jgi:hypothetical protein
MGPINVLTITKDQAIVKWVLAMQKVGFSITLM